jgi:hypothetical protein
MDPPQLRLLDTPHETPHDPHTTPRVIPLPSFRTHSRLSRLEPQPLVKPLSILVPHLDMRHRASNGFTRNDRNPALSLSVGWEQRGRCGRVKCGSEGVEQEGSAEALGSVRSEHAGASASASVEGADGPDLGVSSMRRLDSVWGCNPDSTVESGRK